jgi:hypothetical protein
MNNLLLINILCIDKFFKKQKTFIILINIKTFINFFAKNNNINN